MVFMEKSANRIRSPTKKLDFTRFILRLTGFHSSNVKIITKIFLTL